jgi:hypothetical protein
MRQAASGILSWQRVAAADGTSISAQIKQLICKGWGLHAEGKNIIHGGAEGVES